MSIKFKSIERKNIQNPTAKPKHYALAIASGKTDLDGLAALISDGSTVRQGDVYAVLIGLVNAISLELAAGRTVNMGKLGSFSIGISSEGVEEEKEVTSSLIKGSKIRYRPSTELKNVLKTLHYQKTG